MIKKSIVILLLVILFSLFAAPHEARASGDGVVTGLAIAASIPVIVGIISILISSDDDTQSSVKQEKKEISAESSAVNSGDEHYNMEYSAKTETLESPYILAIRF